jgi:hypothetical protein
MGQKIMWIMGGRALIVISNWLKGDYWIAVIVNGQILIHPKLMMMMVVVDD